jgi:hypothetical protein
MTSEASFWPTTNSAKRNAAPSRETSPRLAKTIPTPRMPPVQTHQGPPLPGVGTGVRVAVATATIVSALTTTETNVAGIGPPTTGRSLLLIPAWIGSSVPTKMAKRT